LALGEVDSLALPFESYKLAFTPELAQQIFVNSGKLTAAAMNSLLTDEGKYVHSEGDANWWIPSGRIFFSSSSTDTPAQELAHAREHFFLPRRFRDPFGEEAFVSYDSDDTNPEKNYNLLVVKTEDALGNVVTVATQDDNGSSSIRIDYRVLQPYWVTDPNGNRTRVVFDALGMVVGTAGVGKPPPAPVTGGSLGGLDGHLTQAGAATVYYADHPPLPRPRLLNSA